MHLHYLYIGVKNTVVSYQQTLFIFFNTWEQMDKTKPVVASWGVKKIKWYFLK